MPTTTFSNHLDADDANTFTNGDFDDDASIDVTCPGCDARLNNDALFTRVRICPNCSRHFWMPARERLNLLVDPGTFRESNAELVSADPLVFRDAVAPAGGGDSATYPLNEALVTGTARIGGQEAVVIIIDFALQGEDLGVVAGEKIVLAIEHAANRRLPLVAACAGGAQRTGASMLSLVQSVRIANAIARLQRNGVPFIAMLSHPTAGSLFAGFACHANLLFAEPGSQIGLATHPGTPIGVELPITPETAEAALVEGYLDGVVDRRNMRDHLVTLLDILISRGVPRVAAAPEAAAVSATSASQEAAIARNPNRPGGLEYVQRLMPGFVELHGDRNGSEEPQVRIGLGQLDGVSLGVICVDRSTDGTMADSIAGYRKATRLLRLASLLELPVLTLIDNLDRSSVVGGAQVGSAMALLARTITTVPVPTVAVVLGEASGAHTLVFAVADRTLMMEHAVYSPTGTEIERAGPAGIRAAIAPKPMTSRDCRRLGLVESIIPEPGEGAHVDPQGAAQQLRLAVSHALGELSGIGPRRLQDERGRKFRHLGIASPAGTEEVRLEVAQLQELQRTVGRSIDDLRDRIDMHHLGLPSLPPLPQRPGMPAKPAMPGVARPNLPSIRRPSVNRSEIAELAGRLASTGREFAERVSDARSNLTDSIVHPPPPPTPEDKPEE